MYSLTDELTPSPNQVPNPERDRNNDMILSDKIDNLIKILAGKFIMFHWGRNITLRITVHPSTFRVYERSKGNFLACKSNQFDISFKKTTFPTRLRFKSIAVKIIKLQFNLAVS